MHHLHREVAAALLREREPAAAVAVEGVFVERVLVLGSRLKEPWDAARAGTASEEELLLSRLLVPEGAGVASAKVPVVTVS